MDVKIDIIVYTQQLMQQNKVSTSVVQLYLDVAEKGRQLVETYFNLKTPLYFDFTHLVCRTALDGKNQRAFIPVCYIPGEGNTWPWQGRSAVMTPIFVISELYRSLCYVSSWSD